MVRSSSIQQSGKKLINSLMDTHTKIVRPVKSFVLKSSMEFATRSLSVFNKLNAIESNHKTWVSVNETHESFDLNNNNNEPPSVSSDVFKKPYAPVSRKRKGGFLPYRKNMKKWIKYSLKDIPISSDATNTAVALHFLDELRKKKEIKENEISCSDEKVMFRKPGKRCIEMNNCVVSTSDCSNEVLDHHSEEMPAKKIKRSGSNIKLLHLQDNSDDTF